MSNARGSAITIKKGETTQIKHENSSQSEKQALAFTPKILKVAEGSVAKVTLHRKSIKMGSEIV